MSRRQTRSSVKKVVAEVKAQHEKAERLLRSHMDKLHELTKCLKAEEGITGTKISAGFLPSIVPDFILISTVLRTVYGNSIEPSRVSRDSSELNICIPDHG